jgi:COMPASS component SWD2
LNTLSADSWTTDAIRYLATHDNSFIRYFEGHDGTVTSLALHPGTDNFISCSRDNTVRLWNIGTKQWVGKLFLNTPYLAAWDPSGAVFAIASPSSASVLLYDYRNYTKAPFATFDVADSISDMGVQHTPLGWTKLEFSNDGKSILLGMRGDGHVLLDSFDGNLKAYLKKPEGGTTRIAAGDAPVANGAPATEPANLESSGECCFAPDGRYVLSGSKKDVLVWDTLSSALSSKTLEPTHVLEEKREAAVVAFSPRYNLFATADQDLMFWLPDPHA